MSKMTRVRFDHYTIYGSLTKNGPYDGDNVLDLITWLKNKLDNEVPAAYRDKVKLEIETNPDYDGYTTEVTFYYDRMETPEEEAERERHAEANALAEYNWAKQRLEAAEKALKEKK